MAKLKTSEFMDDYVVKFSGILSEIESKERR